MNYTYCRTSESGSFAAPSGRNVRHASSKRELADALADWRDDHSSVGSDESAASLHVWKGRIDDVTDLYPDFEVVSGPRGGARFLSC